MTTTELLRKQVKKYVDTADEASLRRVQAILEIDMDADFWSSLPEQVKDDVQVALAQSERGEGRSNEEVKKKYDQWRTK